MACFTRINTKRQEETEKKCYLDNKAPTLHKVKNERLGLSLIFVQITFSYDIET